MKDNKKFSWKMIATFLSIAAVLVTIIMFFSHSQERIAKLEEYKENIVDNLNDKVNELERKVQELNCRISWLEGFIHSYTQNRWIYKDKNPEEKKG